MCTHCFVPAGSIVAILNFLPHSTDVDTRCYERRRVVASTRNIPDPDEITVDTSDAQVSGSVRSTLYLFDIPSGRICIFLQLEGGLTR